jgi:hypothetical protein
MWAPFPSLQLGQLFPGTKRKDERESKNISTMEQVEAYVGIVHFHNWINIFLPLSFSL